MKTKVILLALALDALPCLLTAQDGNPPRDGQRSAPRKSGGERDGEGPATENPTDAQRTQVKIILSKYHANALTAEQAKAIHEAFRQAGLRGGSSVNEAVKEAGVDPDKLRDLPPSPGQSNGGNKRPPGREGDTPQDRDGLRARKSLRA